jgi:hypothetical protein
VSNLWSHLLSRRVRKLPRTPRVPDGRCVSHIVGADVPHPGGRKRVLAVVTDLEAGCPPAHQTPIAHGVPVLPLATIDARVIIRAL